MIDPELKKLRCDFLAGCEASDEMSESAKTFMLESAARKYSYNFDFMGRPIIQYPQDMVAIQQLILQVKPDLIIETGIAHGGSLIMSAAMLALLDVCEAEIAGTGLNPGQSERLVVGIDVDIRSHNRNEIECHPLSSRIRMIEGSSIDEKVMNQILNLAVGHDRILVVLDSNHTHEHVLSELNFYGPLVSRDSYCVVMDTVIDDLPIDFFPDREWAVGNNPKTAVQEFLSNHNGFVVDEQIEKSLQITVAPHGYLKRVK